MKVAINIGTNKLIMDVAHLEKLIEVLCIEGIEAQTSKWVGGSSGSVEVLEEFRPSTHFALAVLSPAEYDLLKFNTEQIGKK